MHKELYLIRHCQATGQQPDARLTVDGEKQAERLADVLSYTSIKRIIASPFTRVVQSIEPLARLLNLPVETDPHLQERVLTSTNHPDWREHLRQTFDQLDLRFPGGESSWEAMQRASTVVQDLLSQQPTGAVAIVSHGNLTTLLLKLFDDKVGFSTWENMTTPDVFYLRLFEADTSIARIWQPDA